jgi:hypothetical protein
LSDILLAIVFLLTLFGLGVLFLYAVVFFFSWVSGSPVDEATRLIFRMLLGFGAGQVLGLVWDVIFLHARELPHARRAGRALHRVVAVYSCVVVVYVQGVAGEVVAVKQVRDSHAACVCTDLAKPRNCCTCQ